MTEGENMVERLPGFIRLSVNTTNATVLVRASSVEMLRGEAWGDCFVQTTNGGIYVNEPFDEVLTALRTALSQPNEEGEGE